MLKKLFGRQSAPAQKEIVVVSGLPRSGTSMMMKMLEQGGLQVVTDSLRTADDDNPKGYYEFETVKQMPSGQTAWLDGAQGKVVKVISALLEYLPSKYHYKVIFMERAIGEVLASQKKMLDNRQVAVDAQYLMAALDQDPRDVFAKAIETHNNKLSAAVFAPHVCTTH